ncbi:hypothetical protein KAI46_06065 [bacterium]|nr:hypothetical protein [bacterium]
MQERPGREGNLIVDNKLVGMKSICKYLNISESTALKRQRECDMPIKKIGGEWNSTKRALIKWHEKQIEAEGS